MGELTIQSSRKSKKYGKKRRQKGNEGGNDREKWRLTHSVSCDTQMTRYLNLFAINLAWLIKRMYRRIICNGSRTLARE